MQTALLLLADVVIVASLYAVVAREEREQEWQDPAEEETNRSRILERGRRGRMSGGGPDRLGVQLPGVAWDRHSPRELMALWKGDIAGPLKSKAPAASDVATRGEKDVSGTTAADAWKVHRSMMRGQA